MWANDEWPVGSVCSAAGGMDLGFERAGFTTKWVCEVDPFRRKLLAKHFPAATQYPDLTTLDTDELEAVRVLIGGTPCQGFSNAGHGFGLDDPRSALFHHFIRVRNALNVEWCVWENVLGAFSTNSGMDFASVLGAFVGAAVDVPAGGWPSAGVATGPWGGCVYRVLNAQHFGVPQRRRRVFVVGRLGGPCPPEVLFEPAGSGGTVEARGEEGKTLPPRLESALQELSAAIRTSDKTLTLTALTSVASFSENQRAEIVESPTARALTLGGGKPGQGYSAVRVGSTVRRLTPTERERLMGWPDGWTVL